MTIRVPATASFAACLSLGAVTSVLAFAAPDQGLTPRLPLALIVACFAPGYLLLCGLFPTEQDMGHLLRCGLSLACSFPLIILLTLLMSVTPFNRSATAQILAMNGLLFLLAAAATWRQWREPAARRLTYLLATGDGSLFRDRFALASLALAAVLTVAAITSVIGSGRDLSTALSIPTGGTSVNPIQANSVAVHVESHETAPKGFQIRVSWQGHDLGRSAPFTLQPGESTTQTVETTPPPGQGPAPVDVMLFRQGDTVAFRQLRVWMRTVPYRPPS
jgi:hypothetical protein